MTALLATPFITIAKQLTSHRAAQGVIYADQLKQAGVDVYVNMTLDRYKYDFNEYDELYAYHGNDWGGTVNLFGGLKGFPYTLNFVNFSRFKGKVHSLVIPFPNYYEQLKPRYDKYVAEGKEIDPKWHAVDWDNLKRMELESDVVVPNDLIKYPRISIGDSHAICMYRPSWQNISIPFKTLHGALKQKLKSFIPTGNYETIEFYFGNIDIRHHLLRQEDPIKATETLIQEYMNQCKQIAADYNCKVVVYEPLPIENESRSLPKTGYYKGTPFFGSWQERNNIRKHFRNELISNQTENVTVFKWVDKLINQAGELDFKYMEKPHSVHLSREFYPHWQGREWSGINMTQTASLEAFFI